MVLLRVSLLVAVFILFSIFPTQSQFASTKPSSFRLELIHRDSPRSPLYPGNITFTERINRYLKYYENQVMFMSSKKVIEPDLMKPYVVRDDNIQYLVKIGIGTPYKNVFLIMDTGSRFTWIQCEPCQQCFKQNYPIFDPRNSSTFRKIPCNSPLCSLYFSCFKGECPFALRYADGHLTRGVASWETFTVATNGEREYVLEDILFGCSRISQGVFSRTGNVAGIMGMNKSPVSIISQLGTYIERRFSYCLVSPYLQNVPMSFLRFGSDIGFSKDVQTTPLVDDPANMYALNLLDISIQQTRLNYPPDTFKRKPSGEGGFIIDSGTPYTSFNSAAYPRLELAVAEYLSRYHPLRPMKCPSNLLTLCYYIDSFNSYPTLTFHFENADLKLPIENVFYINKEQNYFGLAMGPWNGETIFGAWQQFNFRFIFDLDTNKMSFFYQDCATDSS